MRVFRISDYNYYFITIQSGRLFKSQSTLISVFQSEQNKNMSKTQRREDQT